MTILRACFVSGVWYLGIGQFGISADLSNKTQNTKHQIPQGGNDFDFLHIHQA